MSWEIVLADPLSRVVQVRFGSWWRRVTQPNAPRPLGDRYLVEREEISRGLTAERSFAEIARGLGRRTSTVSREVNNNGGREKYRAVAADTAARARARRPKVAKLAADPELRVPHETIYQAI